MNTGANEDVPVKTTKRSFQVIETLKELDGATPTEAADHLGMVKSTVHNHLATLHRMGYLVKEEDEYNIGMEFLRLGEYAHNRKEIYQLAEPKVQELAERTEERAQFIVAEHGLCVVVHQAFGSRAVFTEPREKPIYMHCSAAGKCILAQFPEERVRAVVDRHDLPARTSDTITDLDVLFDQLERVRERGYAFNDQENIEGLRAVAAPVLGPDGYVQGAFSISAPYKRLTGEWYEEEVPDTILGVTNEVELKIKY